MSSKKPSATKHIPPSNFYYLDFYGNFLIEYGLIGIVKPQCNLPAEMKYDAEF